MHEVFIYDGIRTAFGRHGGALAGVRPDELLARTIRELVKRNNFDGSLVEDVVAGDTNQAGEDARNVARNAALLAGLPTTVAGSRKRSRRAATTSRFPTRLGRLARRWRTSR